MPSSAPLANRRTWRPPQLLACALALAAGVGATKIGAAALQAQDANKALEPEQLVLQQSDVGHTYAKNESFSRPRTFSEASNGDSPAVRRLLKKMWIEGYQTGFNGLTVLWGISSTADVFVSSSLDAIVNAWRNDILRLTNGQPLSVPRNAPGTHRFLVRGRVAYAGDTINILIYMWHEKRVIASVSLAGVRATLPVRVLFSLAQRQDSKVRNRL